MTWVVKAANANQMRQFDLKGREGGTRAGLDKLWNDNTAHGTGSAAWHLRISLCKCARQHDPSNGREIIYFTSYVQYRCVVTPVAEQKTESCCAQNLCFFFFFLNHVGWCYWKLSGSFLCEPCCSELGPGLAWGQLQSCYVLAWPQSAFLSHAAPDLLTHFLTQEIELTPWPGPSGPTAAYAAVP